MNPRQKLMLGILIGAVALWQVPSLIMSWVFDPVSTREAEVDKVTSEIQKKDQKRLTQKKARKDLVEMGKRSLPPDPVIAAGVFQNWLVECTTNAKLTNVTIDRPTADKQKKENTYFAVHAIIKGQGTLGQVTYLLRDFQNAGLLMRLTNLKLEATRKDGDPNLKIEIGLDALSMVNSPERKTLWADGKAPGPMPGTKLATAEDFEQIAKKNLFVRGYNGPPKPPDPPGPPPAPPPTPPKEPSTAEYVYLVGSVMRNGVPDAFLYDRSSNKQTTLKTGGDFKAGGMEGKVLAIADKSVTLKVGEDEFKLELGKNLTQMQKLAKAEASEGT